MTLDIALWEGRRAMTDDPSVSAESFGTAGWKLMELNLLAEAIDFFARAGEAEGLKAVQSRAAEEGHFFLYLSAASKSPAAAAEKEALLKLAAAAEKNGQALYAAQARDYLAKNFN